jgi:hypothetical protein
MRNHLFNQPVSVATGRDRPPRLALGRLFGLPLMIWLYVALVVSPGPVEADLAPASVAGRVYYFYVTNSSQTLRIGTFYLVRFVDSRRFVMFPDLSGTYTYTKTGRDTATAVAVAASGLQWNFEISFDTLTSGLHCYTTTGGGYPPENGCGTFVQIPTCCDLAPTNIVGKAYAYYVTNSSNPLALGRSLVSYGTNTYHLPSRGGGYPEEYGSYTFTKTGPVRATGITTATNAPVAGLRRSISVVFSSAMSGSFSYSANGGPLPSESGIGVFMEMAYPPSITTQPQSQTGHIGHTVTLNIVCTGSPPLSYQWRKNYTNLTDKGGITAPLPQH